MQFTNQIARQNVFPELSSLLDNWKNHSQEIKSIILQNILRSFKLQNYPLLQKENKVILVYQGKVNSVALLSDITGWTDPIQFKN